MNGNGTEVERQEAAELATLREQYAEQGIRAWLLAPDIPTYLSLMNGEKVPVDRLRPEALARYGLKRG